MDFKDLSNTGAKKGGIKKVICRKLLKDITKMKKLPFKKFVVLKNYFPNKSLNDNNNSNRLK